MIFNPLSPTIRYISAYKSPRNPPTDSTGLMVGAVGIENNPGRSFKDLEKMQGSAKTLKRHSEERKGILIGPSMAPRFFKVAKIPSS